MKMNNKKVKLSNKLLVNYVIIIILLILFSVTIFFGYIIFKFFNESPMIILDDNEYEIVLKGNEDINKIIEYGGFYEIIDDNLTIIYEENSSLKDGYEYTLVEFLKIIVSGKRKNYNTTIKFDLETDNMVIIGLPDDIQNIGLTDGDLNEAKLRNLKQKVGVFVIGLFIMVSVLLYSKITSRTFVKPLTDLLKSIDKMKEGDYSVRTEIKDSIQEIVEVKKAFNHMAEKIQDESELKNKSEQVRKQMILDISHDLKNPLTSIQGYSEFLIKNDNVSNEKRLEMLNIINRNSVRANNLIKELFEYSKLQSEEYKIKFEMNDICEFLRELIAIFIPQFEEKQFEYDFSIPDREILVSFDKKQLDRAISNIINNAIKYNNIGTKLLIYLVDSENDIIIIIKDNGKGIPKEMKSEIFKPFIRGDESRNSKTGGTGLGLAIAENIIERHKGIITLNDTDTGCEFEIKIPRKYKNNK
ncbi:sensor histidine kinase [Oceanirhabdus sp. W0125-5]|uniref:sensor histidine kinase n=1 Tax=Oceanirhabdus sp. W0125-5 TaxID=2999116 RepID=UPI0022F316AA|nr:HAMP domain-containing sensor histidine kinase [Oceanirhabdus sp. W0125-5]WBW97629.1 HAMP domain-containing sensor histidine kinase [Oceanirhabdus sp. W0125-5]